MTSSSGWNWRAVRGGIGGQVEPDRPEDLEEAWIPVQRSEDRIGSDKGQIEGPLARAPLQPADRPRGVSLAHVHQREGLGVDVARLRPTLQTPLDRTEIGRAHV